MDKQIIRFKNSNVKYNFLVSDKIYNLIENLCINTTNKNYIKCFDCYNDIALTEELKYKKYSKNIEYEIIENNELLYFMKDIKIWDEIEVILNLLNFNSYLFFKKDESNIYLKSNLGNLNLDINNNFKIINFNGIFNNLYDSENIAEILTNDLNIISKNLYNCDIVYFDITDSNNSNQFQNKYKNSKINFQKILNCALSFL